MPTWGVNETSLGGVFLPPVSQNVAEKKRGETAASAHLKPSAALLKHGKHVAPWLVGSGEPPEAGCGLCVCERVTDSAGCFDLPGREHLHAFCKILFQYSY